MNATMIDEEKTREQLIAELKAAREKLLQQERLATLGEMAGNISHEIRNPLGVIDSSAYFLIKTHLPEIDEKSKEHLDRIREAVKNATSIIESLLNLSSMDTPHTERIDLLDIATESISSFDIPHSIHVEKNFPKEPLCVEVDPQQIRIALNNLVKNAVDAMGDKGTLTMTIRLKDDNQIEATVRDNGPGIPSEYLDKVFLPLFSTKAKGIGFGLSITKMIVEKHGGTIEIIPSEEGNGAGFLICLPSAKTDRTTAGKMRKFRD